MSIKANTVYNMMGAVAPMLVAVLTVPPYLRVIGVERYGVMSLFWVVLTYFSLFDLGLGRAVSQRLASLGDGVDARDEANGLVWSGLVISIVMGLAGAMILMPAALMVVGRFDVHAGGLAREIGVSVPWLSATLPVALLQGIAAGALTGRERFGVVNLVEGTGNILTVVAPLAVALLLGPTLAHLIAAVFIVRLVSTVILLFHTRRTVPLGRPVMPDRAGAMRLLGFGGWITIDGLVGTAIALWDRFVIGAMLGPAAVSVYSIPSTLVMRLLIIPGALGRAFFPRLARVEEETAGALAADAGFALSLLLAPGIVVGIALVAPFLSLWIGTDLAARSAPVAQILLPAIYANGIASLWLTLIQARNRPATLAWLHIGELLPYALFLFWAIRWYGVEGAALAWSLRTIVDAMALGLLSRIARSRLALLMMPMMLVVSAAIVAYGWPATHWGYWLVQAAILGLTAVCVAWQAPPQVRQLLRSLLDRLPRRLPA